MLEAEALVRERLLNSLAAAKLAVYAGLPAIFFQEAPGDKAEEWGDTQYPRIVIVSDTYADAARGKRKTLAIDIICEHTGTSPEEIEPFVRQALAGVFLTPPGGTTFSAQWRETLVFKEQVGDREDGIHGMTVNFEIYEYPLLETSDPDPIAAICRFAEGWDERLKVIGLAELPDIYEPTRDNPAAYFSRGRLTLDRQTNTVVWMNAELTAHFFAPALQDRIEWVEQFTQSLALEGEVIMLDGSPMFLRTLTGDAAGDEIQGQLTIGVQYGLLRRPRYAHTLQRTRLGWGGKPKSGTPDQHGNRRGGQWNAKQGKNSKQGGKDNGKQSEEATAKDLGYGTERHPVPRGGTDAGGGKGLRSNQGARPRGDAVEWLGPWR